jgi:hypothetical protein
MTDLDRVEGHHSVQISQRTHKIEQFGLGHPVQVTLSFVCICGCGEGIETGSFNEAKRWADAHVGVVTRQFIAPDSARRLAEIQQANIERLLEP